MNDEQETNFTSHARNIIEACARIVLSGSQAEELKARHQYVLWLAYHIPVASNVRLADGVTEDLQFRTHVHTPHTSIGTRDALKAASYLSSRPSGSSSSAKGDASLSAGAGSRWGENARGKLFGPRRRARYRNALGYSPHERTPNAARVPGDWHNLHTWEEGSQPDDSWQSWQSRTRT